MEKFLKFRKIVSNSLFFLFVSQFSYSQPVCGKYQIHGFENEKIVADSYNGVLSTEKISESKLYISVKGDKIYVQSNFLPDESSEYPIKLATSPQKGFNSLDDYLFNIYIFGIKEKEKISQFEFDKISNELQNNVEFTIDPSFFNSSEFNTLDLSSYNNIKIACPDKISRQSFKIKDENGKIEYLVKYDDTIFIRIKNQNLNFIFSSTKKQRIDPNKIKIVSLIENSSTKELLTKNFTDKTLPFDYKSIEGFKELLLKNKGNRTIILGHIEKGNFVTIESGKEIFKISIDLIETFAKENDLSLIILGCNSAQNGAGSGVLKKFNSIDVLNQLKNIVNVNNIETFLNNLSDGTFDFVLDESFFSKEKDILQTEKINLPERIEFNVYVKNKPNSKFVKTPAIGKIIFIESNIASQYATETDSLGVPKEEMASILTDTSLINSLEIPNYPVENSDVESGTTTGQIIFYLVLGTLIFFGGRYLLKNKK